MKQIYFMRPVGQIGPIKIGCSKLPARRLETYLPWSPTRLEIVCATPGTHADERRLHGMFAAHHLHHEWFGASKELLALIEAIEATGSLPELPKVLPFSTRTPVKLPRKKVARKGGFGGGRKAGISDAKRTLYEQFVAEYRAGSDVSDIAERHGVGIHTVYGGLRYLKCPMRSKGRRQTTKIWEEDYRAAEFRARYEGGETLEAIGQSHGITRERVRQILRAANVPSLGHRDEHKVKAAPLADWERALAADYLGGVRPRELRAKYGVTNTGLNAALRRTKTPKKTKGHWLFLPGDAERVRHVCELYRAGVKPAEIAQRAGLAHSTYVYRYLARGGVKARNQDHWKIRAQKAAA